MAPDNIPYDKEWLRLLDAVERIKATNGIDEDPAKIGLCFALSDRKIKFRGFVGKVESLREYAYADASLIVGTLRESYEFDIPLHLTPHDFDWLQSRPVKPWPKHKYSLSGLTDYWRLDWIELRRADVEKVLCGAQRQSKGLASTVKDETFAAKMLAPHLKLHPDLKRDDAAKWCSQRGFDHPPSGRVFGRVWADARVQAGLPAKASPGAKRKNRRAGIVAVN